MNAILDFFWNASPLTSILWMLAENVALFTLALVGGEIIVRLFVDRRVTPAPPAVTGREIFLAVLCILMNTVVTIAGWWIWRHHYITIRRDMGLRAWSDALVLLLLMDAGMYFTHRLAHWPPVFNILHAAHHHFDHPRPLNLFCLHPGEVLGFGALWLSVLWLYPSSWLGTCVYLTLNLIFGTLGHVGVEPFPRSWARWRVARQIGTSTFHAEHHVRREYNFGFYTLVWDRLFGTLDPEYEAKWTPRSSSSSKLV